MCGVVPPSGGGAAQRKDTHRQLLITSANKRQTLTFSEDWRMWQREYPKATPPPILVNLLITEDKAGTAQILKIPPGTHKLVHFFFNRK